MDEKNFRGSASEESTPILPSGAFDGADRASADIISTRDLLEPIFMKTFYFGVTVPFLFGYLGSSNVLALFDGQAQWLVGRLGPVWPVLPAQFELVGKVRGVGHAASFGFMSGLLWLWPVVFAVASLRAHAKRGREVSPVSTKEILQFFVAFPFAIFFLVFDTTGIASPLFGFHSDQHGLFYLRQWFVFSGTAIVSGILLYVLGRAVLSQIWCRPD